MAKFHVNPKSLEVGKCRAQKDGCPFGGAEEHFSNAKAAGAFAESQALMPESHRKGTKNLRDGAFMYGVKSFSDAPGGTKVDIGGFRYLKLANDSWGKGISEEHFTDLQMDALGTGYVSTDGYDFSPVHTTESLKEQTSQLLVKELTRFTRTRTLESASGAPPP